MTRRITAYFQLIRLPNVLTAAADSLAGWLLAMGSFAEPNRWLSLVMASMVLYASGTALNDVFDVEIDREERPSRPLPSGRISWRAAAWLGGLGLAIGPILAFMSGSVTSAIVAAILALCILSYDAGLKHTGLGPAFMGACRGLNLLLGMTHSAALGGPIGWLAAIVYGLFVAGITVVSRSEAKGGGRGWLVSGLGLQDVAIVGFAAVALAHQRFPHPSTGPSLDPSGRFARARSGGDRAQCRGLPRDRAADPSAHPENREDRHPQPGLASRWPGRRRARTGISSAGRRDLGSRVPPRPLALLDLTGHF